MVRAIIIQTRKQKHYFHSTMGHIQILIVNPLKELNACRLWCSSCICCYLREDKGTQTGVLFVFSNAKGEIFIKCVNII
jgi:hypothetical protein